MDFISQGMRGGSPLHWIMWDAVTNLSIVILVAVAVITVLYVARARLSGTIPVGAIGALFGTKPERRLDILEHVNLDARRRLILIRRDDIEHLILTGGPADVVIETGITASQRRGLQSGPADAAFSKGSRVGAPFGSDN